MKILLKVLLRQLYPQTHRAFCREYDKVGTKIDKTLVGAYPGEARFCRWLSGGLVGLPCPDHCRILESMFPEWKADQLFEPYNGGIEFVPEPPPTTTPKRVTAALACRSAVESVCSSWARRSTTGTLRAT